MKTSKNFLAIILLLGIALTGCNKDELERIPYGEIPDLFFRDFLLVNFDTDVDGFISEKEAKRVKEMDLSEKSFASLKGIEYFTSLEKLVIGDFSGTELDLSKNVILKELYCSGYNLSALDLSKNNMLEVLTCRFNNLQTLNLPESKRLKFLNCSNARLSSVNLSGFEFLEEFIFIPDYNGYYHSIEKLEITNSSIKRINCQEVKNLIISNLPNLELLSVKNSYGISGNHVVDLTKSTKLKTIVLVGIDCEIKTNLCPDLETLICESYADLSKNTALKYLDISVPENSDLDISNCPALETFYFLGYKSKVSSLKKNPVLKIVSIKAYNDGETLDFSANTLIEKLSVIGNVDITNPSNSKNLTEVYIASNNRINTVDFSQLNTLKNATLLGCPNLTSINFSGCQHLNSLIIKHVYEVLDIDISGCKDLYSLTLEDLKNFNKLNASGCSSLISLYNEEYNFYNRSPKILDLSDCTSLRSLSWNNNQLTSLNVKGCIALTQLSCISNHLSSLDVSGCTALTMLNCYTNNLENLNVVSCVSLDTLSCDNNKLTSLDVSSCANLTYLTCSDNKLENLNLGKNKMLKTLRCYANQLASLDVSDHSFLTHLTCDNNKIVDLQLNGCVSLNTLYCGNNKMKELDAHTCLALKELHCYNNGSLKTLILDKNHQITTLYKDDHTQIVLHE